MKRELNGLIVIDKPGGVTSRDAVNRLQSFFPRRTRIGHTGTLDPLATGALVVCLGSATRLAEYVQALDKVYHTRLVLGGRSDTDDADGTITPASGAVPIDDTEITSALAGFVGELEQVPPAYSAIKIEGRRAHTLARRGERVEIAPRKVNIHAIELLEYRWPELVLEIRCGKGTYIRSLARDLGEKLGCGAYVKQLRRTSVGPFTTEGSVSLDDSAAVAYQKILPLGAAVAHLPTFHADAAAIEALRHGQAVRGSGSAREVESRAGDLAIVDVSGALIGVGRLDEQGLIRPVKVFATN